MPRTSKKKRRTAEPTVELPKTAMQERWGKLYYDKVRHIFIEAMNNPESHERLCADLRRIHDEERPADFRRAFLECVFYNLTIMESLPYVENSIDFIVKFSVAITGADSEHAELNDEDFTVHLLTMMMGVVGAQKTAPRFRAVQITRRLLEAMSQSCNMPDDLFEEIKAKLLERAWDKVVAVRVEAVRSLKRLQEPDQADCEVIALYLHLVKHDPAPEVRKNVLLHMYLTTLTLPAVVERSLDVSDIVRRTTFEVLAERVGFKALSIARRVELLYNGFNDISESVVEACRKLLQRWLHSPTIAGSFEKLLKVLDVATASGEVDLIMKELLKDETNLQQAQEQLKELLDERKLIREYRVNSETISLAFSVLKTVEDVEALSPGVGDMCSFLSFVQQRLANETEDTAKFDWEFVLKRSLEILLKLDVSDEFSRRSLLAHLKEALMNLQLPHELVKDFLQVYKKLLNNDERLIADAVELITELRGDEDESLPVDANVLWRCCELAHKSFWLCEVRKLLPHQRSLVETLILASVKRKEIPIRELSVSALGIACARDFPLAVRHIPLLLLVTKIDGESVRASALKGIFDIFLVHGIKALTSEQPPEQTPIKEETGGDDVDSLLAAFAEVEVSELFDTKLMNSTSASAHSQKNVQPEQEVSSQEAASNLLTFMIDQLDSENPELRTICAEGLSKILMVGHLISYKVLARLILLWFNPRTEGDTKLRHRLSCFFPAFSLSKATNQVALAKSAVFVLRTLLKAPASSRLSEVDPENVTEFILRLTNPNSLEENDDDQEEFNAYEVMLLEMSSEVARAPNGANLRTYLSLLKTLVIEVTRSDVRCEAVEILRPVVAVTKDKHSARTLQILVSLLGGSQPTPAVQRIQRQFDATVEPTMLEDSQATFLKHRPNFAQVEVLNSTGIEASADSDKDVQDAADSNEDVQNAYDSNKDVQDAANSNNVQDAVDSNEDVQDAEISQSSPQGAADADETITAASPIFTKTPSVRVEIPAAAVTSSVDVDITREEVQHDQVELNSSVVVEEHSCASSQKSSIAMDTDDDTSTMTSSEDVTVLSDKSVVLDVSSADVDSDGPTNAKKVPKRTSRAARIQNVSVSVRRHRSAASNSSQSSVQSSRGSSTRRSARISAQEKSYSPVYR